ncbi:MAG: hypothetical protein Q4G09_00375 [Clostridia bacterium]|nr:hypothetical protein [Clostridia bacterium]
MKTDKNKLIKIIEECNNEEDLKFLEMLLTETFLNAVKLKNENRKKGNKTEL